MRLKYEILKSLHTSNDLSTTTFAVLGTFDNTGQIQNLYTIKISNCAFFLVFSNIQTWIFAPLY